MNLTLRPSHQLNTDRRITELNRISALVSAEPDLSFRAIEKLQGPQPEYFETAYSEDFQGQCECNLAPRLRSLVAVERWRLAAEAAASRPCPAS
jgi:hypothetical protein